MHIPEFRVQRRDGRKKDSDGNPITRKGDKHPNLVNGYVLWETVQLADLAKTKKLGTGIQVYTLSGPARCYPKSTNYYG